MSVSNTPTNTTALTVTEALVLSKTQREDLVALFVETNSAKVRRVKGLLRYHKWTADQIIAAMHESADRDGVELVVDDKSRSTIKRTMAIVKPWFATGANDLCTGEDDTRDAVFLYLSQIADITGAALEKYLVDEEFRTDSKVPEWEEVVIPAGYFSESSPEIGIDVPHGSGNGAMAAIIAEFVTHRAKSGDIAAEWLRLYKCAVQYANNERRRANQAHDSNAAGARVGTGDGSNQRGARNAGGTGSKDTPDPAEKPEVPDHRMAGDKTVREATVQELAVALTKRVVDYSQPMTAEDLAAINELNGYLDQRIEHVPIGAVVAQPEKPMVVADKAQVAAQTAVNTAPVLPGSKDAMIRALLAEFTAAGITAETLAALVPAAA